MARPPSPVEAGAVPGRLAATGGGHFSLSGDVGFNDAARLLAAGDAAFAGLDRADIDLAGVTRVDSAGLALLLEWSMAAGDAGRVLNYLNVPPALASLAEISGVSGLIGASAGA